MVWSIQIDQEIQSTEWLISSFDRPLRIDSYSNSSNISSVSTM